MSLLMQALQKAAKEREDAVQPQSHRTLLAGELALEPLAMESRLDPAATGAKSSAAAAAPC